MDDYCFKLFAKLFRPGLTFLMKEGSTVFYEDVYLWKLIYLNF